MSAIVLCFVVRYFMSIQQPIRFRYLVNSSMAIILKGKRELVTLFDLSSWCLVMVGWLFIAVPWGCMRFVIVIFPDHIHLLFL